MLTSCCLRVVVTNTVHILAVRSMAYWCILCLVLNETNNGAVSCSRLGPHDVNFTWQLLNTLALLATLVGPPYHLPPVRAQNENECTVGEVVEGTTLVGFPGDDVCVAAT